MHASSSTTTLDILLGTLLHTQIHIPCANLRMFYHLAINCYHHMDHACEGHLNMSQPKN